MKKRNSTFLIVLIFLSGLALLLYPIVSNYVNEQNQTSAVARYDEMVQQSEPEDFSALWDAAVTYNNRFIGKETVSYLDEEATTEYEAMLNATGTGIMGYVSIPSINVSLPIYHGSDASVLQIAVGHLPYTSLPVGGESTHSALSSHTGLPSAKLFSDLDQMQIGDVFFLHVLDRVLAYEVDQILTVLPEESENLRIEPGEDLCTLVTCTPYGVNTHRLLLRGHRVEYSEAVAKAYTSDATQISSIKVAAILAVPILFVLLIVFLINTRKMRKSKISKKYNRQGGDTSNEKT